MSTAMKELAKQMVRELEFGSTGEIMTAIKERFAEVLQEAQYICYANAPCQATHFFALHNGSRTGYRAWDQVLSQISILFDFEAA